MTDQQDRTPSTFPPGDTDARLGRESRSPSGFVSMNGNGSKPDRRTRRIARRLDRKGHHMVADVVRSYREHPAKGKPKSRTHIKWGNVFMYVVAILLPVFLVEGEWWRVYLWACLDVAVVMSVVSKPVAARRLKRRA